MNVGKKSFLNMAYITAFLVFVSCLIFLNPSVSVAELSVDSYCELCIESMEQEVSNYKELIELVRQYSHDPEALARQERLKRTEFDSAKEDLYTSFGTSTQEYILYMGKNRDAVNDYLEKHPDTKLKIDSLMFQINFVLVVYESVKEDL